MLFNVYQGTTVHTHRTGLTSIANVDTYLRGLTPDASKGYGTVADLIFLPAQRVRETAASHAFSSWRCAPLARAARTARDPPPRTGPADRKEVAVEPCFAVQPSVGSYNAR